MTARVPLIACVAVLAFFAGITGVRLAYTLAYVLVLLLAVAYIWSRLLARKLRVTRESPQGSFMMGEPFEETFTVKNESGLRLPYCEVRDGTKLPGYAPGRAFALAAGGSVTWTARGMFNLRGVHRFGPLEARLGDPFGLFPRRIRVAPENEVIVYPAIHALLHSVPQWSGNGVAEAHRGQPVDVPPDVSTIRDYAPTDGLSRIHWASTARTGRLISRTFDTGQSADLLIVLDLAARHPCRHRHRVIDRVRDLDHRVGGARRDPARSGGRPGHQLARRHELRRRAGRGAAPPAPRLPRARHRRRRAQPGRDDQQARRRLARTRRHGGDHPQPFERLGRGAGRQRHPRPAPSLHLHRADVIRSHRDRRCAFRRRGASPSTGGWSVAATCSAPANARRQPADGMDAYVDRTVQLRESRTNRTVRAGTTASRSPRSLCVALIAATAWAVLAAGLGARRWRRDRGRGHIGDRGGAARPGARPAHRRRGRRPISRARGDRADHTRGDAGRSRPDRRASSPGTTERARSPGSPRRQDWDFTVGPVRDPLPLRVLARMDGPARASRRARGDPGLLGSCHQCRQRARPRPDRAARDDRGGARDRGGRRRIPGIARRSLGGVAHHRARRPRLAVREQRGGGCGGADDRCAAAARRCRRPTSRRGSFPTGSAAARTARGTGTTTVGGADTIGFSPSVTLGGPLVSHPQLGHDVLGQHHRHRSTSGLPTTPNSSTAAGIQRMAATNAAIRHDVDSPGPLPRDTNLADGGIGSSEQTVTATLTMQPNATGEEPLVPFTGDPASVNLPGTAYGTLRGPDANQLLTVDEVQLNHDIVAGTTIATTAYISTATAAQLSAAGTNYPGWTRSVHGDARRRQPGCRDDSQPGVAVDRAGADGSVRRGGRDRAAPARSRRSSSTR